MRETVDNLKKTINKIGFPSSQAGEWYKPNSYWLWLNTFWDLSKLLMCMV